MSAKRAAYGTVIAATRRAIQEWSLDTFTASEIADDVIRRNPKMNLESVGGTVRLLNAYGEIRVVRWEGWTKMYGKKVEAEL